MDLAGKLRECGVVGAGGAGFPTYVKAGAQVEFVIANGAECEPLIHKDVELMKQFPAEILSGMNSMMKSTGASRGKFGIKEKNVAAVGAIRHHTDPRKIDLVFLGDFYPSGDEYELVYTAIGRLIPAAGLPLHVGCVVTNVETLYNVHLARKDIPVTRKFVSVAGAVKQPKSFWVPIGTSFQDIIELAGGATVNEFGMFVNGIMMGRLSFDLEDVVTRTTAGLIVLPKEHYLVNRKSQPLEAMNRIGKSACDQCSYCTEFCPRYLLGYEVQPHKVMRSLGFSMSGADNWNQWAELCCACGLCTLYACPEDLFPKEACDQAKTSMRVGGIKFVQKSDVRVHPMKEYRRVPLAQLRKRLKIEEYETQTPFEPVDFRPGLVRIKLSQHAGKPAKPVVTPGEKVGIGAVVGRVDPPELGVNIHSSINGTVKSVTGTFIEIHT